MRRTQTADVQYPCRTEPVKRWLVPTPLPSVGLDPAIWSQRVQQVALWRLIEAWTAGRRLH